MGGGGGWGRGGVLIDLPTSGCPSLPTKMEGQGGYCPPQSAGEDIVTAEHLCSVGPVLDTEIGVICSVLLSVERTSEPRRQGGPSSY